MENSAPRDVSRRSGPRVPLKIEENLAGIILGILALLTFANVVVRYLTNFSFAFTEEISIILMVIMALLGSSSLMAKGGHLDIAFLVDKLPERLRLKAKVAAVLVCALTFLFLCVLSGVMAWDEYRFEVTSPGLGIPTWVYTVWMPVLFLAVAGRAVGRAIRMLRGADRC